MAIREMSNRVRIACSKHPECYAREAASEAVRASLYDDGKEDIQEREEVIQLAEDEKTEDQDTTKDAGAGPDEGNVG